MSRHLEPQPAPERVRRVIPARKRPAPRLTLVSALLGITFSAAPARAEKVVYVDVTHASASDTGPGTANLPYRSISEALAANPEPGVTVIVLPGVYRERVMVPASGTAESPVVIRAMGNAVVDASEDMSWSGWFTQLSGDAWVAPVVGVRPKQVFADGARLTESAQPEPALVEAGSFGWFQGVGLVVNVGGGNPASHALAVSMRSHGFLLQGRNHVEIDGFTITRAGDKGIEVLGGAGVKLRNNTVSQSFSAGIAVTNASGVLVQGNHVSGNNHHGIEFRAGVTGSLIEHNESFANAHAGEAWATGIYLANSPGNTIQDNLVHENQDSGLEIQTGSNDCLVRQNVSWSNGDHGFALLYVTGTTLLNNSAWGNATEGFSVEGTSTGTHLYNNISVNRALAPESYCLYVDASSLPGLDADHDIYWNIADLPPVKLGPSVYRTVLDMQAATGMGQHSFGADPRFVNAFEGDFHLKSDSPAIDAARTDLPGWMETDAEQHWRIDVPATPNTGSGTVPFADRGALEYQGVTLSVGEGGPMREVKVRAAYPNPSRRGVTFALELPTAARVGLSVFDVLGREVWSDDRERPAGHSEVAWGLGDRSGGRVPNGLYLARVNRGGESNAVRFVVVQ